MEEYKYTIKDIAALIPKYTEVYLNSLASHFQDQLDRKKIKGHGKSFFYTEESVNKLKELSESKFKLTGFKKIKEENKANKVVAKTVTDLSDYILFNSVVKDIPFVLEVSRSGLNQNVFAFVEPYKLNKSLYIHKKDLERTKSIAERYVEENTDEYVPNLFTVYEIRKTKDGKLVLIHKPTNDSEPIITNPTHQELIKTMKNLN